MQLVNAFTVDRSVEEAWPLLTDIERLATCIPGAAITEREGDTYRGDVVIRVGPVALRFEGTAEVASLDAAARSMSVRARGHDRSGQGNVDAVITMRLAPDGPVRTAVTVRTDLDLGGRVAQFGAGMIEKVSGRIIKQFVARLHDQFSDRAAPGGTRVPAAARAAHAAPARAAPAHAADQDARDELLVHALALLLAVAGAFLLGAAWEWPGKRKRAGR
jgi:uncharacterized protein